MAPERTTDEIAIRTVGRVGRITLTRPKALNALTHAMAGAIETALDAWQEERAVELIVVDSEGDKAFCAGGDIQHLYRTGMEGDYETGRAFWADEYRLNARIANSAIPYVPIMNGIVMGGGVGISAHGKPRLVTDNTMLAMPECGIGLVPDVGGSFILSRAPGHLGEFLAMTGWRMKAADAILAGFADRYVPAARLPELKERLEESGDLSALEQASEMPEPSSLRGERERIDRHFAGASALECLHSLEADESEFAGKAAAMIRKGCPLSVACAFEIVRRVRELPTLEDALAQEYRFTYRSMSEGEFLEGIRAQVIDKDRTPNWRVPRLEDVTAPMIEAMLAPLGDNELDLGGSKP